MKPFFQVLREKCESHLQSATGNHIKLVQEELTKRTSRNEERCEALQEELNTVKGQFEREVSSNAQGRTSEFACSFSRERK